jgi:hypothetical protein
MAINYPTSLDSFTNPSASSLLTSPSHAQQHADINDAMEAVQTKLAIGNTVIGTYTAYTPTWIGVTVGNGTSNFKYARVNKLVHYVGVFTLGTTSAITGSVNISLPINASTLYSTLNFVPFGHCLFVDASTVLPYEATGIGITSINTARLRYKQIPSGTAVVNSNISATVPFTWTTSDTITIDFTYEAA